MKIPKLLEDKEKIISLLVIPLILSVIQSIIGLSNPVILFIAISCSLLIYFIIFAILEKVKSASFDEGRKKGIILFIFMLLGSLILIFIWENLLGPRISSLLIHDSDVNLLIRGHRWITYDPLEFNPDLSIQPSRESIERELGWISQAGFDGIITFNSLGIFSDLPEIAKKYDLAIIMGIWDPTNQDEINNAISQRDFVDAYCVGHNGVNDRYTYDELRWAVQFLRFHTFLPVSTTEKIGKYFVDKKLLTIGDWIFPDTHVSLQEPDSVYLGKFNADAIRDAQETMKLANQIASLEDRKEKPILLKMVTYPIKGATNASREEQSAFFNALLDCRRNVAPCISQDVFISVHSAFDIEWKQGWPYYPWDPFTGLLDDSGDPRPATLEIVKRLP